MASRQRRVWLLGALVIPLAMIVAACGVTPSTPAPGADATTTSASATPLTVSGVRIWKFPSGVGPVYMRINPILDPHKWSILTYNSGENLG